MGSRFIGCIRKVAIKKNVIVYTVPDLNLFFRVGSPWFILTHQSLPSYNDVKFGFFFFMEGNWLLLRYCNGIAR